MANPFSVFRRNQRAMLAIFGVLLMIAFVLSGSMNSWSGTSRTPQNPPVVRTDYGTLHEQELQTMTMMRSVVGSFLQQLVRLRIDGMATKGEVRTEQEKALYERFFTERLINPVLARYHQQQPEYAAVETMILARRADELGIVVSENSVNEFIRFVTDNQVSAGDIQETISHINLGGGPISQRRLFDALRTELKASRLQQMFQVSLGPLPPGERWDYYTRLKRQVNTEIMPVPVKNFVERIPDPSDDDLKIFFEKYKYQIAFAGSPNPGFKKPPRGQFQYFKAAYDNFVDQAEVTDEEIEEYYNDHKDPTFRKSELPADPDTGAKRPDAGSDGSADAATSDQSTNDPSTDAPANADAPSDTPQPDSSEDQPAEQDANSTEPKTDAAPNADKDKSDKQSSVNRPVIRLAAASNEQLLAQADKKAPAAKAPASIATSKASPAASPPAQPANTAESKTDDASSDETKSADAKADDAKADDAKSEDQPAADESASDDKPANTDKSADEDDEFEPLEKVRDQIRRELANRWIQRKIDGIFDQLMGEMREYADQRILDSTKEYPPFDFEGAAKRFGLDAFETGMLSPQQLFTTDLGKSSILDEVGRPRYRVAQRAFSKNAQDLQPETSVDLENHRYLYWRIKHEDEEVPALEDVRKQVLQAWKMKEARTLAREQAEKLAAEARSKDHTTLAGTFGAEKVRETGKFSWLTFGNAANVDAPQMSDVPGVEMAGHEFMQTVHHMELGEIGVALNQPETVAYVVRVTDVDLPTNAFEEFATTDPKLYAAVAGSEQQRTFQDWMRSLEESVHLHWEREPRASQSM